MLFKRIADLFDQSGFSMWHNLQHARQQDNADALKMVPHFQEAARNLKRILFGAHLRAWNFSLFAAFAFKYAPISVRLSRRGPTQKAPPAMNLSSRISPNLPFLRRFSRALTGSQQSGDAYVAAVLDSIIADPASLSCEPDIRVALYRQYCRIWQSVSFNMKSPGIADPFGGRAHQLVGSISPKAREAFLLSGVEGFGVDEIGLILDCSAVQVQLLLAESTATFATQPITDVLVIEDEPIIAMDIEDILISLGHRVTGIARTESQALLLAAVKRPGLILADIQLADGSSGLDAVSKILQLFSVPVIFITAFPESVLTGERPEPAFLISKPYLPEMVKAVISQALMTHTNVKEAT